MTPYKLRILLHYYVCPLDYDGDRAPILQETLDDFVATGLLAENAIDPDTIGIQSAYRATDKLRCYIDAILSLPLPVWRMP